MARVIRRLACPAAVLFGALALVLGVQPWASAASGGPAQPPAVPGPSGWSALQDQALRAVSGPGGAGSLDRVQDVGPVRTSTLSTASGQVPVVERSVVASGAGGPMDLVLSWLGGTQLVVTATSPGNASADLTLVLAPGTFQVQGRYPLGVAQARTAAVVHRGAVRARDAVIRTGGRHRSSARLASTNGCAGYAEAPTVIGSVYGPLIESTGIIDCPYPNTLGMILSIYEYGSAITTVSGGANTSGYALNAYHVCSLISGSNAFQTAELWSVNGSLYGSSSPVAYLGCA